MTARRGYDHEIQSSYDALSGWYDRLAAWSEGPIARLALDLLSVRAGEEVLELGPGAGRALLSLAREVGAPGRVCGVDLSPGMLRRSRERLLAAGQTRRVALLCGDAAYLPLRASSMDAALALFTLEILEREALARALAECRRVLRPGGRIVVVALSERGHSLVGRAYDQARARYPRWLNCRPIRIRPLLVGAGYDLIDAIPASLWGLPVDVVLARSPAPL